MTAFASKRAAKLADELGIAVDRISGTGRVGTITVADVRAAAVAAAPPAGLGEAGQQLWSAITASVDDEHELDEREEAILNLAARQADDLARLEAVIATEGATTAGSTGQRVVHPAIQEARQARLAIGRLLGQLDLTEELGSRGTAASDRGRRAAQARWQRTGTRGHQRAALLDERLF